MSSNFAKPKPVGLDGSSVGDKRYDHAQKIGENLVCRTMKKEPSIDRFVWHSVYPSSAVPHGVWIVVSGLPAIFQGLVSGLCLA